MKKSKIKKSMLAIPEPLWQCLLSSLLYKLSLSFWIRPLPPEKPPCRYLFFPFLVSSSCFESSSASPLVASCHQPHFSARANLPSAAWEKKKKKIKTKKLSPASQPQGGSTPCQIWIQEWRKDIPRIFLQNWAYRINVYFEFKMCGGIKQCDSWWSRIKFKRSWR